MSSLPTDPAKISEPAPMLPPRVLIVMSEQWPRALLRAALREVGYDAVGTRSLRSALRIRRGDPERGPVQLIVLEQSVVNQGTSDQLGQLLSVNEMPATILIARPTVSVPAGDWQRVLKRPVSIDDIVSAIQELLPLAPEQRHPLD